MQNATYKREIKINIHDTYLYNYIQNPFALCNGIQHCSRGQTRLFVRSCTFIQVVFCFQRSYKVGEGLVALYSVFSVSKGHTRLGKVWDLKVLHGVFWLIRL